MGVINFTKANCRNCYKCIRYCPVKAIQLVDKQAKIVEDLCIGCGNCFRVCPQNAKKVVSYVDEIKGWLEKEPVVLSLAPSFPSAFKMKDPLALLTALRALGFTVIEETAVGAELVSTCYAEDYYSDKKHVITTSCPTINLLIEKYYPQVVPYLSAAVSPMVAHSRVLKEKYNGAKVVFAGPCISKKLEAGDYDDCIDAVLSFDEIDLWLRKEGVLPEAQAPGAFDSTACDVARYYPLTGGVEMTSIPGVQGSRRVVKIDGLKNCRDFLDDIDNLENSYWIEMNACVEGCVNGPGNTHSPLVKYEKIEQVKKYIENNPRIEKKQEEVKTVDLYRSFEPDYAGELGVVPEAELDKILRKMGKFSASDELNCGTCGYDSCRQKAAAVYYGMAELDMCLPYMRNRNEAISNLIISTTPNGIAVLDKELNILDFNYAAENLFKVAKSEVLGKNFVKIFGYNPFVKMGNATSYSGRGHYLKGDIHFMEILTYIPTQEMYMGIFVDISREIKKEQSYREMQVETLDMAQKVIDKQMRVAHEIAELLGETTAETKVTLTRLQKIVGKEGDV